MKAEGKKTCPQNLKPHPKEMVSGKGQHGGSTATLRTMAEGTCAFKNTRGVPVLSGHLLRFREAFILTKERTCWCRCPAAGELQRKSVAGGLGTRDRVPVLLRPMRGRPTGTRISDQVAAKM